ncbi:MAG: hypothetical protein ABJD07_07025 [Gemmatimonadaceae bacterium]
MKEDLLDQRFSEFLNALVKIVRERGRDPTVAIRAMPGRRISCSLDPVVAGGWTTWTLSPEMLSGSEPGDLAKQLAGAWDATLERRRSAGAG